MNHALDALFWGDDAFDGRWLCCFGSSQGGTTNTIQQSGPWAGEAPYLGGANATATQGATTGIYPWAQSLFLNDTPQYYPSDTYAPLTGQQQSLMSNLIGQTSGGGTSGLQAANSNVTNALSPEYTALTGGTFGSGNNVLNTELQSSYLNPQNNPEYETAMSNVAAQALPAASASFVNGSRSDSGLASAAETSGLTNALGGLASQQYNTNQGIQQGAVNTASSNLLAQQGNQAKDLLTAPIIDQESLANQTTGLNVAGMYQTDQQNQINANVASYNYGQMQQWNQLGLYENAITGSNPSGGTSSTSSPYFTNPSANLLSAGLGAAGLASAANSAGLFSGIGSIFGDLTGAMAGFSDRRLKTDIEKIGETDSGFPLYVFRYKGEPLMSRHIGVMAQDVEQTLPEAVYTLPSGFKIVDYKQALAA